VEESKLYYGDNLTVCASTSRTSRSTLIYLDPPPFNTRQDYNVLFAGRDGTRSASQIMAFEDTWESLAEPRTDQHSAISRNFSMTISACPSLIGLTGPFGTGCSTARRRFWLHVADIVRFGYQA